MPMNTRRCALSLALALAGCQGGRTPGVEPIDKTLEAPPRLLAATAPVTPMQMIAAGPVAATHDVAAPWSLTASDGSGLVLVRVEAKAVVQGPLAFTELHLYFHNPEARIREGTFAITLPSGAAVSRFAMENAGQWQEAEVVEKAVARRVYDDFLHRKQDPALLEKAAGNQFSARVFPIPAKGDKHLVLSFSQELAGRAYTLPLRGLPRVERVDVSLGAIRLDGSRHDQALTERNWQPDRDFVATIPAPAAAVSSGGLVVGALAIAEGNAAMLAPEAPRQLTLLVDTSASRALGFAAYVASIRQLIAQLRTTYGDPLELRVIAFDQDSQPIFDGPAAGYGAAQDAALLQRGAAGASNIAQVIATLAASRKPAHRRLVIVTDGVVTAGPPTPELVTAIQKLPIERVDVVLAGGIRDERLAASLARSGLPRAGDVHDLDRGIQSVAAGLGESVLVDVAIEVPGAIWSYPKTIPAARPGSTLMVYARMATPTQAIEVVVGGTRRTVGLGAATPALLERAVAGAEIEELENRLAAARDAEAKALREQIARRSVQARVISSQTSMLVLESEADYARYKIARTSLADILVVGPTGIEQTRRATIIAAKDEHAADEDVVVENRPNATGTREQAIVAARNTGVLGSRMPEGGTFQSLTGTGDISSGFSDHSAYGDLLGNEDDSGDAGHGSSGFGPGGGGTGWGTIGTGRYGTIGHDAGTGTGYGVGGGRGGMRGRSSAVPTVAIGRPSVAGDLHRAVVRRYIKRNIQKIQYCYEKELLAKPSLTGAIATRFVINASGTIAEVTATGVDPTVASCIAGVIRAIEFPRPRSGGTVEVSFPFGFSPSGSAQVDPAPLLAGDHGDPAGPPEPATWPTDPRPADPDRDEDKTPPLTGKLHDVMTAIQRGNLGKAMAIAKPWHEKSPGDVLALVALGETLEANKDLAGAARIYGSIIDLFSSRADFRRFAGERLERLGAASRALVVDTYRKAVADRPDHVTGHRLLAYALVRSGDHAGSFAAILAGIDHTYPDGRFAGAQRVLEEDAGMIAAVYLANGGNRDHVTQELTKRSLQLARGPSTRFIMYWETDANDVDFHIRDARGGHAYYASRELPSGGELYADVTTGYGPECFAIQGTPPAAPYKLSINYFSQGPMGYGMGLLQIQKFDGTKLSFEDRPYVIMRDHAFVDLGSFR
ncbi:MAG: putative signal peptide protein [Myxococcales bacterium]|nr:putative signal peptide protein [Myxococcales bacterium]